MNNNVRIVIDFEITPELVGIYSRSTHCTFVGEKDGPYCLSRSAQELQRIATTKMYGNNERLGIMKIYHQDQLVGFALPRVLQVKEHKVFKLDEDQTYHRVGTVFIDHPHRGKGIIGQAIKLFKAIYPNLIWTCDEKNTSSQKAAVKGDLKFSHLIYFKSKTEWSFEPMLDHVRVSHVYVS
mgnify:CR=1 FL=1